MNHLTHILQLSDTERAILVLIAEGLSNSAVANILYISEETVESYRNEMVSKAGAPDMAALIRIAVKQGLVL